MNPEPLKKMVPDFFFHYQQQELPENRDRTNIFKNKDEKM